MNWRDSSGRDLERKLSNVGKGPFSSISETDIINTCGVLDSRLAIFWILVRLERVLPLNVDALSANISLGLICWNLDTQP